MLSNIIFNVPIDPPLTTDSSFKKVSLFLVFLHYAIIFVLFIALWHMLFKCHLMFDLLHTWNWQLLQEFQVICSGEWYLEISWWVLALLTDAGAIVSRDALDDRKGNVEIKFFKKCVFFFSLLVTLT